MSAENIQLLSPGDNVFPTDVNGPENPIHQLSVFSRGLPVKGEFLNGFRRKQREVAFTEPAMHHVLRGIDVRPTTLIMHPRAHMFPDKIEAIVFHAKSGVFDYALGHVAELEAFNRRRLNHVYSYGLVTDVAKTSNSSSWIPYGWFHKDIATQLGSEIWSVKRKDQRAEALEKYLSFVRENKDSADLGENKLTTQEKADRDQLLSSFATSQITKMNDEEQAALVNTMKQQQERYPFIHTNYYRVNYYVTQGGDFFYADVVPDEKASFRQWTEWFWVRTAHFYKTHIKGDKKQNQQQTLSFKNGGTLE